MFLAPIFTAEALDEAESLISLSSQQFPTQTFCMEPKTDTLKSKESGILLFMKSNYYKTLFKPLLLGYMNVELWSFIILFNNGSPVWLSLCNFEVLFGFWSRQMPSMAWGHALISTLSTQPSLYLLPLWSAESSSAPLSLSIHLVR